MTTTNPDNDHCLGCVYYPPNLPPSAYAEEDYRMLQAKDCSFDHQPGDEGCRITRKTSCSMVDLEQLQQPAYDKEIAS